MRLRNILLQEYLTSMNMNIQITPRIYKNPLGATGYKLDVMSPQPMRPPPLCDCQTVKD